ncbi:MAG: hypothetical protein KDD62_05475, partial [Bdellovibrionales bacterium]|nr:hypothetical protein [Bdellovibrionales bacterium]
MHIAQTQLVKQPPLAVSNTPSGEASFQTAHVTNFDLSKKGQNGVNITLPQVGLTYCVFADGEFDPRKRTVVLQSAISGSPRAVVQSKKAQQTEGWFTSNIGAGEAGRLIDLKKFNVICFDYLGGNGTPELPNRGPGSALSLGNLCERITMQDSVNLQATILKRNFGLDCVSVVGGSFGGVCARKFLEQDIIQVDRVLDISSPGVHSSRAKNFFSTMRDVLERRVVGRAVTDDIDKLFGNLPGADLRGYRVAMGHVQRLFTKLDIQSASDHELMQAVRPFSFLGYIHPNGIHQRFEEHRDKSVTKSQSLRHWLNYHAETYANSVCPRATA